MEILSKLFQNLAKFSKILVFEVQNFPKFNKGGLEKERGGWKNFPKLISGGPLIRYPRVWRDGHKEANFAQQRWGLAP